MLRHPATAASRARTALVLPPLLLPSILLLVTNVAAFSLMATGARQEEAGKMRFLGEYGRLRVTGEHAYGHLLELWAKPDGTLVGRWSVADGQPADVPTTMVSQLQHDPRRGWLRFSARWCGAVDHFDGVWRGRTVQGRVRRIPSRGEAAPTETVVLRRIDESTTGETMAIAEWERRTADILKRRGPTC